MKNLSKKNEIIKSLIERSLLIIKKIYLYVSCYDIIMEPRELSELNEDNIAEILTKLGLVWTYLVVYSAYSVVERQKHVETVFHEYFVRFA